jgi:hypothetical protein
VDLNCTKLGSRDVHAKDNAESRDNVRFGLETSASGADRKKVIGIGGILRSAELMIETPSEKGVVRVRR